MRSVVVLSLMAALAPVAARAGDKVLYGPPAAWVITTAPQGASAPADPADDETRTPIRVLLADRQSRFTAEGVTNYQVLRMKIETADGLSAGNLTQQWDPATGDLMIHRLHVVRDGKVIDVLKTQKFEILRRERSLEQSMLDGQLTAAVQIADLRVGDIIDLATTRSEQDPPLAGRNSLMGVFTSPIPLGQTRMRAIWDKGEMQWRVGDGLPKATIEQRPGGGGEFRFEASNFKGSQLPEGAPVRYMTKGIIEVSQLKSWKDASTGFRPLYDKASTLEPDSPLTAEIERIRRAGKTPEERAALALQLVQDQIRYVAISMNAQGFVPATADETWRRRFGDCKGKTALLLALLKNLDIEAAPVLVATSGGEALQVMLPRADAFDHVLVKASIGGKDYWLDGTRAGDGPLPAMKVPDLGWGLPLTQAGSELVRIKPAPSERPDVQSTLRIDASKGFDKDVPVELEIILRSEDAGAAARAYGSLPKAEVQRSIIDSYGEDYGWVNFKEASWRYAPDESKLVFVLKGMGTPDVRDTSGGGKQYQIPGATLYAPTVKLRPEDQDVSAPYAVTPGYARSLTVIRLPANPDSYSLVGNAYYGRSAGEQRARWGYKYRDTVYTVLSTRSVDEEVSAERMAEDAASARRFQSSVLALRWFADGKPLPKEQLTRADGTPFTTIPRNLYSEMTRTGPGSQPWPQAMREAMDKVYKSKDAAEALSILDANKAAFSDSEEEFAIYRADALNQLNRKDEAIVLLEQQLPPSKTSSRSAILGMRAVAEQKIGRIDAAERAVSEALKLDPKNLRMLDVAIELKVQQRDFNGSLALQQQRVRAAPDEPSSWLGLAATQAILKRWDDALRSYDDAAESGGEGGGLGRAATLAQLGRRDEAMALVDAYLAAAPTDATSLNNACWARATANLQLEKALGECERAVKASDVPGHVDSLAFVKMRLGRYAEAIADYDKVIAKNAKMSPSLYGRGLARIRSGQVAAGEADLAEARKITPAIDVQFNGYGLAPPP